MAQERILSRLIECGMSNTCIICNTPFAQGQACPNHPNNAPTIVAPAPPGDTLDEGQGDNLSTVNDTSHFGSNRAGEYVLIEKLGEGGMGEVWLAVHPTIQKKVAVKILHAKFVSNKQILSRFMQEAKAVNQIEHKNLVDIFTFGELPDKRPYFVMEYLQGKSLTQYLKKKGVLPYSEILIILGQLCKALDVAHQAGVIHRDIKPDNLHLILDEGAPPFVKILDFGIAKLTDTPEAQALTRTGMIFGTPAYMSPEQCEGAKKVDHRSDQYSIGVILYEMLTGKNPFKERGDSVAIILKKQILIDPPPPSSLAKGRHFPKGIDQVVLKALSKTPSKRFQNCNEFHEALVNAIEYKEPQTSNEAKTLLNAEATVLDTEEKPNPIAPQLTEKLKRLTIPEATTPTKPNDTRSLVVILLIASIVGGGIGLFIVSQLAKKNSATAPSASKILTPSN
jgi:serine/threonine protein kinase